jgi:hypothetical protein
MNKNIKIAKELVKLAKNLIALDEEGDRIGKITYYSDLDDCNDKNIKQFANLGFCSCIAIKEYES